MQEPRINFLIILKIIHVPKIIHLKTELIGVESVEICCSNGTTRTQWAAANQSSTAEEMIQYSKLWGPNLYCKYSSLGGVSWGLPTSSHLWHTNSTRAHSPNGDAFLKRAFKKSSPFLAFTGVHVYSQSS